MRTTDPAGPHEGAVRGGALGVGRGVLLAVVVLAPEAAAWHGLLAVARETFGMTGWWAYLVPLLFGAAAGYVALLAMRYVLQGDSAMTERALTWVYGAAGAGFNWWHAVSSSTGNVASALFFGGASLSAVLLWDRTLRAWRRDELRAIGALEAPLPRFRALRWVLAPGQTFAAFRAAVVLGLTSPDEAIAAGEATRQAGRTPGDLVIERRAAAAVALSGERPAITAASSKDASLADLPVVERRVPLTELPSAAALREAWAAAGVVGVPSLEETCAAVEWLTERGVEVSAKYAREVRLREQRRVDAPGRPVLTQVKASA